MEIYDRLTPIDEEEERKDAIGSQAWRQTLDSMQRNTKEQIDRPGVPQSHFFKGQAWGASPSAAQQVAPGQRPGSAKQGQRNATNPQLMFPGRQEHQRAPEGSSQGSFFSMTQNTPKEFRSNRPVSAAPKQGLYGGADDQGYHYAAKKRPKYMIYDKEYLYDQMIKQKLLLTQSNKQNSALQASIGQYTEKINRQEKIIQELSQQQSGITPTSNYGKTKSEPSIIIALKRQNRDLKDDRQKKQEEVEGIRKMLKITTIHEKEAEINYYKEHCGNLKEQLRSMMAYNEMAERGEIEGVGPSSMPNSQGNADEKGLQQQHIIQTLKKENARFAMIFQEYEKEIKKWQQIAKDAEAKSIKGNKASTAKSKRKQNELKSQVEKLETDNEELRNQIELMKKEEPVSKIVEKESMPYVKEIDNKEKDNKRTDDLERTLKDFRATKEKDNAKLKRMESMLAAKEMMYEKASNEVFRLAMIEEAMGDPEDIRKHEILLKERDMMLDKANSEVFRLALVEQERYSMEKDLFRLRDENGKLKERVKELENAKPAPMKEKKKKSKDKKQKVEYKIEKEKSVSMEEAYEKEVEEEYPPEKKSAPPPLERKDTDPTFLDPVKYEAVSYFIPQIKLQLNLKSINPDDISEKVLRVRLTNIITLDELVEILKGEPLNLDGNLLILGRYLIEDQTAEKIAFTFSEGSSCLAIADKLAKFIGDYQSDPRLNIPLIHSFANRIYPKARYSNLVRYFIRYDRYERRILNRDAIFEVFQNSLQVDLTPDEQWLIICTGRRTNKELEELEYQRILDLLADGFINYCVSEETMHEEVKEIFGQIAEYMSVNNLNVTTLFQHNKFTKGPKSTECIKMKDFNQKFELLKLDVYEHKLLKKILGDNEGDINMEMLIEILGGIGVEIYPAEEKKPSPSKGKHKKKKLDVSTLTDESLRTMIGLTNYILEFQTPLYELFQGNIVSQAIRTKTTHKEIEIIEAEKFYMILKQIGIVTSTELNNNLLLFLCLDKNYVEKIMLKKLQNAIQEFATDDKLRDLAKKYYKDNEGEKLDDDYSRSFEKEGGLEDMKFGFSPANKSGKGENIEEKQAGPPIKEKRVETETSKDRSVNHDESYKKKEKKKAKKSSSSISSISSKKSKSSKSSKSGKKSKSSIKSGEELSEEDEIKEKRKGKKGEASSGSDFEDVEDLADEDQPSISEDLQF